MSLPELPKGDKHEAGKQHVALLLDLFTRNMTAAVRYVSGRVLSLAEIGAIREQAAAALRSAFLRGKIARFNKLQAELEPWDADNDPTDPYTGSKKLK